MVKIELGGKPLIDVDAAPGDSGRLKQQIRRKLRGGGRTVHLSWSTSTPRVVLTSDTDEFDPTIISHFIEEGFQLSYLAYQGSHDDYIAKLQHLQDPLELGEKYAIVGMWDTAYIGRFGKFCQCQVFRYSSQCPPLKAIHGTPKLPGIQLTSDKHLNLQRTVTQRPSYSRRA